MAFAYVPMHACTGRDDAAAVQHCVPPPDTEVDPYLANEAAQLERDRHKRE
jgi:hypothetical protein